MYYVVEYDEHHMAWLVEVQSRERIAIEHGMLLEVTQVRLHRPLYQDLPTLTVLLSHQRRSS